MRNINIFPQFLNLMVPRSRKHSWNPQYFWNKISSIEFSNRPYGSFIRPINMGRIFFEDICFSQMDSIPFVSRDEKYFKLDENYFTVSPVTSAISPVLFHPHQQPFRPCSNYGSVDPPPPSHPQKWLSWHKICAMVISKMTKFAG